MTKALRKIVIGLWFPVLLVVLWQFASTAVDNPFFSPPTEIWGALQAVWGWDFVSLHILPTIGLMLWGYLSGASIGVLVGSFVGSRPRLLAVFSPIAVFLRSMPSSAKIPVILGIFGIGITSLYVGVTLSVFANTMVVTMLGVARVPTGRVDQSRLLGLGYLHELFMVRVPSAAGDILVALQSALQVAILVTVFIETQASGRGMGAFTMDSLNLLRVSHLWVAILVLGTIGLLANEAFHALEAKLAPWYFETKGVGR